jgi:hypothetical protein
MLGMDAPVGGIAVEVRYGGTVHPDVHRPHRADDTRIHQFLDFPVIWEHATVVGDKKGYSGLLARRDHVAALLPGSGHRLLDVDGFACGGGLECEFAVRAGRGGDVDGVDVRVGNQRIGVIIPARDVVQSGIFPGFFTGAAHDGRDARAGDLVHGRSAFHPADTARPDDSPANFLIFNVTHHMMIRRAAI